MLIDDRHCHHSRIERHRHGRIECFFAIAEGIAVAAVHNDALIGSVFVLRNDIVHLVSRHRFDAFVPVGIEYGTSAVDDHTFSILTLLAEHS